MSVKIICTDEKEREYLEAFLLCSESDRCPFLELGEHCLDVDCQMCLKDRLVVQKSLNEDMFEELDARVEAYAKDYHSILLDFKYKRNGVTFEKVKESFTRYMTALDLEIMLMRQH